MKILPFQQETPINNNHNLVVESTCSQDLKDSMESVMISSVAHQQRTLIRTNDSGKSFGANRVMDDGTKDVGSSVEDSIASGKKERRMTCSLRVFIVLSLVLLIFTCSVSIYLSVFVAMSQSVQSLTNNVFELLEEKITLYMDAVLKDMKVTGLTMADNYNNQIVHLNDYRKYFLTPYKLSGLSSGYVFSDTNERYSFTFVGKKSETLVYSYKPENFPGLIRDLYDADGNLVRLNETVDPVATNISNRDYYITSIVESERMKTEGAFSKPYLVTNGSLSLAYGARIYDPNLYSKGIKKLRGLTRIVTPLGSISTFLKENVKLFEHGYVIVKEHDSFYMIAGSINTTASDEVSRLNILEKVYQQESMFDELNQVYSSLALTVKWIFPKILSLIADISKLYQSDYQIMSIEQFRIIVEPRKRKSKLIAQEMSLKLKRGFDQLNQQFVDQFETSIKYSMGVSTRNNSFVGNLGTHRSYCIISDSCFVSERLSCLAFHNGIEILVDQQTITEQFVSRPVDRIQNINGIHSTRNTESMYQTVYEIIREATVEVDENKNQNLRVKEYHTIFELFEKSQCEIVCFIQEIKRQLEEFLVERSNDIPTRKLLDFIEYLGDYSHNEEILATIVTNYHTKIKDYHVEPFINK